MSFLVECFLERGLRQGIFQAVLVKDIFFAFSNLGFILVTQWGIFNRCSCWDMHGMRGLALPQVPEITDRLMKLVEVTFPLIVFGAMV